MQSTQILFFLAAAIAVQGYPALHSSQQNIPNEGQLFSMLPHVPKEEAISDSKLTNSIKEQDTPDLEATTDTEESIHLTEDLGDESLQDLPDIEANTEIKQLISILSSLIEESMDEGNMDDSTQDLSEIEADTEVKLISQEQEDDSSEDLSDVEATSESEESINTSSEETSDIVASVENESTIPTEEATNESPEDTSDIEIITDELIAVNEDSVEASAEDTSDTETSAEIEMIAETEDSVEASAEDTSDIEITTDDELIALNEESIEASAEDTSDTETSAEIEMIAETEDSVEASAEDTSDTETAAEIEMIAETEDSVEASAEDTSDPEAATETEMTTEAEEPMEASAEDTSDPEAATGIEMTTEAEEPMEASAEEAATESEVKPFNLTKLIAFINLSRTYSGAIPENVVQQFVEKNFPGLHSSVRENQYQAIIKTIIGLDNIFKNLAPVRRELNGSLKIVHKAIVRSCEILSNYVESLETDSVPYSELPKEVADAITEVVSSLNEAIEHIYPVFPELGNAVLTLIEDIPNMVTAFPAIATYVGAHRKEFRSKLFITFPALEKMVPAFNAGLPKFTQKLVPQILAASFSARPLLSASNENVLPSFQTNNPFLEKTQPLYYPSSEHQFSSSYDSISPYFFRPQHYLLNDYQEPHIRFTFGK